MIEESEGSVTGAGAQSGAAIGMAMAEAAKDPSVASEARTFLRESHLEIASTDKAALARSRRP